MLLSINGPFLTDRAIALHFQFPIAKCRLPILLSLQLAIGNELTSFFDHAESSSAFACCSWSCNHAWVDPMASLDCARPKFFPLLHRGGDPPDSWQHHAP